MRREYEKKNNNIFGLVYKNSGILFNIYKNVGDARRGLGFWKEIADDLDIIEFELKKVKTIDKKPKK